LSKYSNTNALRQEEKNAQRRYIEKLSTSSSKNSIWKAHPSLTTPTETISSLRTIAGGWAPEREMEKVDHSNDTEGRKGPFSFLIIQANKPIVLSFETLRKMSDDPDHPLPDNT